MFRDQAAAAAVALSDGRGGAHILGRWYPTELLDQVT